MITKIGKVTITEDEFMAEGFSFDGSLENKNSTSAQIEVLKWVIVMAKQFLFYARAKIKESDQP